MIQGILRCLLDPDGVLYIFQALRSWKCEKIPEHTCFLRAKFQSIERLNLGRNMEKIGKLEYSQNTRHSAWYLVTVDAFCQRWPPWQQKHSKRVRLSLHGHPNEFNSGQPSWTLFNNGLKGSLLRQVCSKAFRGSVSAQLDIIKWEPHT